MSGILPYYTPNKSMKNLKIIYPNFSICFDARYGFKIAELNGRNARRLRPFCALRRLFYLLTWHRPTTQVPLGTLCAPSTMTTDGPLQWPQPCQQWLQSPLPLYHYRRRTIHSRRLDTKFFSNRTRTNLPCLGRILACLSNSKGLHKPSKPFNSHSWARGRCLFHHLPRFKISNAVFLTVGNCGEAPV